MNENYLTEEQRTEKWFKDRSGKFTGSRFNDVLKRKDDCDFDDQSKGYTDLIYQITLERLTGNYTDTSMDSASLRWGREYEQEAKNYYILEFEFDVQEIGFVQHKELYFAGVSPDGVVTEKKGGVEIKCPKNSFIQMSRFLTGIEDFNVPQVTGAIWTFDAEWWDWVSYDPRMPPHLKLFHQRIYRDEGKVKELETKILRAESDVRDLIEKFSPESVKILLNKFNKESENHG